LSTFGVAISFGKRSAWSTATPKPPPGGNALKFYASVRLDIRKTGTIKNGEQVVGNKTRVKVVKNKVAPPFRECEFEITYGTGISAVGEIVDLASEAGLIEKSGDYYSIDGERIAQGRDKACQYMGEHSELFEELRSKLVALRKAENARLGAPVPVASGESEAA
jgi:recombination protein RecA